MSPIERGAALVARLRASSLGTKLALLGALSTACVVGGAFAALRMSTAQEVRAEFVSELDARQEVLRELEEHDRQLMLQNALMLAESPELRAALQAWRNGDGPARQRVATLAHAVQASFSGLSADDLLLVTDDSGMVITGAGTFAATPPGTSLAALPAVHSALFNDRPTSDAAFGVLRDPALTVEVAVVPLLDDGLPVGALLLGKGLDRIVAINSDLETRQVVTSGSAVLKSNLAALPIGAQWHPEWSHDQPGPPTVAVHGDEYAIATLRLGSGQNGAMVDLHLLRSLNHALEPIETQLTQSFLLAGILAVLFAGLGGASLSRTTLRPLSRFVSFMQSSTDGYARFNEPHAPDEIRALTDSYNRLIESLQRGHQEVQQRTVDLAKANHHLNRQIGRRERAEQALRDSEEQLRQAQKLEALGALAGGVAHDFNNILSIILGYAEIVQSELPPGSSQGGDVAKISDAAVRARTLVRQLLAFSRKQVLQPQVIDLNQVVAGVEPLLRPLTGDAVTLEVRLAPDLAMVKADPGQIEQVIINLAVNARDAMPDGGHLVIETANVVLEDGSSHQPLPGGPVVMLSVADNGTGMDAAIRRRIFEPFFTTKPVGKGTGLGLATVYGIVRQSEGNITVFSEPGEGATFRCYFPQAIAAPPPGALAVPLQSPTTGIETVLVAEDEPELRALLRRALERQGYHVIEATHGAEALELALAHDGTIHALVTDLVMPNMSGKDLAERLLEQRPGLRVLFISGYSDDAIERHGMLTPDSMYLQKPVVPDVLARAVRDLLDSEFATQVIG